MVDKEDDPLISVVQQNQQLPTKGRIAERREVTADLQLLCKVVSPQIRY